MEQFTFSAPALLFSVVSLLLLSYAIWFLVETRIVRSMRATLDEKTNSPLLEPISNVRKRFRQTLSIQVVGFSCILFCMSFVYFIFMYLYILAETMVGISFGNGLLSGHFHP
jgi:hypothetical protein